MCLHTVFSAEKRQRIIAIMPEWSMVWKVVQLTIPKELPALVHGSIEPEYRTFYQGFLIGADEMAAEPLQDGVRLCARRPFSLETSSHILCYYDAGFHSYVKLEKAVAELHCAIYQAVRDAPYQTTAFRAEYHRQPTIIGCALNKNWITDIGREYRELVIVSKKLVFPKTQQYKAEIQRLRPMESVKKNHANTTDIMPTEYKLFTETPERLEKNKKVMELIEAGR